MTTTPSNQFSMEFMTFINEHIDFSAKPMEMVYIPTAARYVFKCSYEERFYPQNAGFKWDPNNRQWWSADPECARMLREFASISCLEYLRLDDAALDRAISISSAVAPTDDFHVASPHGLRYLPYQQAGIEHSIKHVSHLNADEMGLGKTIQALGLINHLYHSPDANPRILILTRASLRINWLAECRRWLVNRNLQIQVVKKWDKITTTLTNIWIINFDKLGDIMEAGLMPEGLDLIIVDECQAVKNKKSGRGKAFYQLEAPRKILLSGTPTPNNPYEIYPLWKWCSPATCPSYPAFSSRFFRKSEKRFGTTYECLDEGGLQIAMRTSGFMLRREKSEVLKDLPAKRRSLILLDNSDVSTLLKKERAMFPSSDITNVDDYLKTIQTLKKDVTDTRKEIAMKKVPHVVEHIEEALKYSPKIILFAHHLDVLDALRTALAPVGVTGFDGRNTYPERDLAIQRFQTDKSVKVFIGGITAAKEGITLTAASHVVFAEMDYVPGTLQQAEDRAHRIGQKDSVLIEYLVFDNSIDCRVAEIMVSKLSTLDKTYNLNQEI